MRLPFLEAMIGANLPPRTAGQPCYLGMSAQPAARCTNAVLHSWLREQLSEILAELPPATAALECANYFNDAGYALT